MKIRTSFTSLLLLVVNLPFAKAQSISVDTVTNNVAIALGKSVKLTIGGQFREMYQYYNNEKWGDIPSKLIDKNGFYWHRIILSGNWQFGSKINLFSELTSSLVSGREGGNRPSIDYNELDISQLYFLITAFQKSKGIFKIKVGRQMYSFGSQRLITTRDGPNNRLSFNGATAIYKKGDFVLTTFIAQPIYNKFNVFDDSVVKSQTVWGANLTRQQPGKATRWELYYYGYSNSSIMLAGNLGKDVRHSVGLFLTSRIKDWEFETEPVLQFGKFNTKKVFGYSVFFKAQNKLLLNKITIIPSLSLAAFSGNRKSNGNTLNTYNPMYPKPPFGLIAPLGPVNLLNCNPGIQISPDNDWQFSLSSDIFWRESNADGLYTPAISPAIQQIYPADSPTVKHSKFIGKDYIAKIDYKMSNYLSFGFLGGYFMAGNYLKQTGKGKDITYLSGNINLKF
jgi:hypothetical protein